MLVIDPDQCIDCGVCEPECPVDAIVPDTKDGTGRWLELNREYASAWPNITQKGEVPRDADSWVDVQDKFDKYFSPKPSSGDITPV